MGIIFEYLVIVFSKVWLKFWGAWFHGFAWFMVVILLLTVRAVSLIKLRRQ